MNINSIEIHGLHDANDIKYKLSDINYFYGKNGTGKSTILQAIQLAVLGYIPGSKKQNASIMKHSKGNVLEVSAVFEDNGELISIERAYIKKGNAIQSTININPEDYPVDLILGDIELPVCNFNEFLSMSSNAQKAWFLKMIPSSEITFNWVKEFNDSAKSTLDKDKLNEFIEEFHLENYPTTIEGCNQLNAVIKQKISLLNALIKDVTGAINSTIMYDDIKCSDYDEEIQNHKQSAQCDQMRILELESLIRSHETRKRTLESYASAKSRMEEAENFYNQYKENKQFVTVEDLERYKYLENEKTQLTEDINNKKLEIAQLKGVINNPGTCPYLKTSCEDLKLHVEESKKKYESIQYLINQADIRLTEIESEQVAISKLMDEQDAYDKHKINAENIYQSAVDSMTNAESLISILSDNDSDIDSLIDDLKLVEDSWNYHNEMITKLSANKKYEELIASVESRKYLYEQQLQCCKIWDKLTGPNGKPSDLAVKPFEDFEKILTKYIQMVFPITFSAKFNISNTANSFEFGVMNEDKFISFEALSSGEKCAYMVCLLSCIVEMSDAKWKCIILDDVFDHLDDERMEQVFSVINSFSKDIQFILASVKDPCKSAIKHSIEVKL